MQDYSYFMGKDGFTWFVGCVEDRNDPERLGRVRVRCLGYHTEDKSKIPTEDLPWASVMSPTTSPSMNGLGETPSFLVPGSWVVGFFTDSQTMQEPIVMGTLPGKNTTQGDKTKGFTDATHPALADFGPYPIRVQETDVNRLAVPSLIHGNRETRDGSYTSDVPIALAQGLGIGGTLFSAGGLLVGGFTNAMTGGFLSDIAKGALSPVESAVGGADILTDIGAEATSALDKTLNAGSVVFNEPTMVFDGALSGAVFQGGSTAASTVTNTFANTAGSFFDGSAFKGFANIAARGLDSASKVAVTATALGKIASGNLSPGGTLAALAATPIGSELIGTVASEVTDGISGLISEETSAFLTDNFDTIVDLGQAGFQIANGDKILGLMTGATATFNAFNENTHIDIGDYSVSVPQITNTLADVIATGLTALQHSLDIFLLVQNF